MTINADSVVRALPGDNEMEVLSATPDGSLDG